MRLKSIDSHRAVIALHFVCCNFFCQLHGSLHVTLAMEAGIAGHAWMVSEPVLE
jgi:hypothetical protein